MSLPALFHPLPASDTSGQPPSDGSSSSGDFSVGYVGGGHVAACIEQSDDGDDSSTGTSGGSQQRDSCTTTSISNTGDGIGAIKFSDVRFVGGAAPHGGAVSLLAGDPIALVEDAAGGLALNTSLVEGALVGAANFSSCSFYSNVAGGAPTSAGGAILIEGRADTAVLAASSTDGTFIRRCDFGGNRVVNPSPRTILGSVDLATARANLYQALEDDGADAVLASSTSVSGTGLYASNDASGVQLS